MTRSLPRRARLRVAAGLVGAAVLVLLGATAASAHVHVDGEDATRGGYGLLTFRVPTESATASTTAVTVTMPTRTPIASASVQPVPGWTATVTTTKLAKPITTDDGQLSTAVARIEWRAAAGGGIAPGQFQQFAVSAGPLPDVAELRFPTLQTYSDGTTVNWNQVATGSAEPEHAAPVLALGAAEGAAVPTDGGSQAVPDSSALVAPLVVGIVAVVLAAAALVVAIIGLLRGAKRDA